MSLIYEPKGRAREYSPFALNVYTEGCDHGCTYCMCKGVTHGRWGRVAKPRNLAGLERDAAAASRQVLLSFMGDPYCEADRTHQRTADALAILARARCSVAILTKGGSRCLEALPTFLDWPDGRIQVGATLTFLDPQRSAAVEPGAACPSDRIATLAALHAAGVKTWASIEPVIDAAESLAVIHASLPHVDAYKVGKLNHEASTTDWRDFCVHAVAVIRAAGKRLYVKHDLRAFAPAGFLRPEECDHDALCLPDRP